MMKERIMCINYIWYIWTVLEEENIKYKENILFGGFHSKMKQENNINNKKKVNSKRSSQHIVRKTTQDMCNQ